MNEFFSVENQHCMSKTEERKKKSWKSIKRFHYYGKYCSYSSTRPTLQLFWWGDHGRPLLQNLKYLTKCFQYPKYVIQCIKYIFILTIEISDSKYIESFRPQMFFSVFNTADPKYLHYHSWVFLSYKFIIYYPSWH